MAVIGDVTLVPLKRDTSGMKGNSFAVSARAWNSALLDDNGEISNKPGFSEQLKIFL